MAWPKPGPGRPKGSQNKVTTALKEAILEAAKEAGDERGGGGLVGYLKHVALTNESTFCSLLGKVLPLQGPDEEKGPVLIVTGVVRRGRDSIGSRGDYEDDVYEDDVPRSDSQLKAEWDMRAGCALSHADCDSVTP